MRETVAELERLARLIYPEPLPLDVITVENVMERYPLTGLGALALTAIEQSHRIMRDRGDHINTGLALFHTGLIYLYWDDSRGAANQFKSTRQWWSLADDCMALCLGHYAHGMSLYYAHHYEAAIQQIGRAEVLLDRLTVGGRAERQTILAPVIRPLLEKAHATLLESLWPSEKQIHQEQPTAPPSQQEREEPPAGAPPPPSQADSQPEGEQPHESTPGPRPAGGVPPQISNLPPESDQRSNGPIPGHTADLNRFSWYIIDRRAGGFLAHANDGAWILADNELDEHPVEGRVHVVVSSARAGLGSIVVWPMSRSSVARYCYLGYYVAEVGPTDLFLNDTGEPAPAGAVMVLAVVHGLWRGINIERGLDG